MTHIMSAILIDCVSVIAAQMKGIVILLSDEIPVVV